MIQFQIEDYPSKREYLFPLRKQSSEANLHPVRVVPERCQPTSSLGAHLRQAGGLADIRCFDEADNDPAMADWLKKRSLRTCEQSSAWVQLQLPVTVGKQ